MMVSEEGTYLYEVDIGGGSCIWWISAKSQFEALYLVNDCEGLEGIEFDDDIKIGLCLEERAKKLKFRDDWTNETRSMLEEWLRDQTPRMVACSEY